MGRLEQHAAGEAGPLTQSDSTRRGFQLQVDTTRRAIEDIQQLTRLRPAQRLWRTQQQVQVAVGVLVILLSIRTLWKSIG